MYVYKNSDGSLVKSESVSAGSYSVTGLADDIEYNVVGVKSDGHLIGYGRVNGVREGTLVISDDFSGTSLDTNKWDVHTEPVSSVYVDDELRLELGSDSAGCGAYVTSKDTISKSGVIEIECEYARGVYKVSDNYMACAIALIDTTKTNRHSYGYREDGWLTVTFRQYGNDAYSRLAVWGESSNLIQTDIGGGAFPNNSRDLFIRLDCSTRELYINLDDGFREGTVTIPTGDFSNLGSNMDLEFSVWDYDTEGNVFYDAIKNLEVWQVT